MTFDLSRLRFDPRRDFLGVVMQQGRVQLDADWNEWVAQLVRRLQAGSLDTFNGSVVPRTTPDGFLIEAAGGGLTIGPGRIYVDGLLAENHGGPPDAWDARLAETVSGASVDYRAQPYYPDPPPLPGGGPHLVYLDVWQRDVSAVEQPDLVEQAVGTDTTGRRQTVWQVKLLPSVGAIACTTDEADIPGWEQATAPSAARLSTDTGDPAFEPDPCRVPPAAGYRGLENQLYRVEVHRGGPLGDATFKWSRDNATVASRVTHINATRDRITVESIGRDDVLRFHDGDWVEVTDDWRELHGLPGELRRVQLAGGVDETARTLQFDTALSPGLFPTDGQQAVDPARNTRVRRWDQSGQVRREDGSAVQDLDAATSGGEIDVPPAGTRLFLENGILVEFDLENAGGEFKTGDHWVFAARSIDASIERLDRAPPLGIHHHYARLAIVEFPNGETDCRTLWPPVAEGQGCDCTVCVSAEGHNSGSATLQQAIDSIKEDGGTLCLGIGSYQIAQPLNLDGARSLRIRGQGWGTLLIGSEPGGVIAIRGGSGVALENLTVIGSAGNVGTTALIDASNVLDLRIEHVNVLGLAVGDGTSVGVALSGFVLGASVTDCGIVAERGIAAAPDEKRNYLLAGELRVARSLFFCSQRAVSLDGMSLHYGNTALEDNLMLTGGQAAVVATGAALPGSPVRIAHNVVYTTGDGIRAGVDGLAVEGNELTGLGEGSGTGIVLGEGVDPVAIDRVRISDNRIIGFRDNGITITHRVEDAAVTGNLMQGLGLAALAMSEGGAAGYLRFADNRCLDLGQTLSEELSFAALQLIQVERGDVLDNLVARVARNSNAMVVPAIHGLRAAAVGQLRLAGNRLYAIGPERGGEITGMRLLAPFADLDCNDNHIERVNSEGQTVGLAEWRALDISPEQSTASLYLAAASYVATEEAVYLLTANRAVAVPLRLSQAAIRGNRLRGQMTITALNRCTGVDHCLFTENHCEVLGEAGKEPLLGLLAGRTLNAGNNRLVGIGKLQTLLLRPQVERAIVIGNTSTGPIDVQNGQPVPDDLNLTNIIGV